MLKFLNLTVFATLLSVLATHNNFVLSLTTYKSHNLKINGQYFASLCSISPSVSLGDFVTPLPNGLRPIMQCAWVCSMAPNCTSFNLVDDVCQFFNLDLQEMLYTEKSGCRHYIPCSKKEYLAWTICCSKGLNAASGRPNSICLNNTSPDVINCPFDALIWIHRQYTGVEVTCLSERLQLYMGSITYTIEVANRSIYLLLQQKSSPSDLFFKRNWNQYESGFCEFPSNCWLGLSGLHRLTANCSLRLTVEIQALSNMQWLYAEYAFFEVSDSLKKYVLNVGGHNGTASDAFNAVIPNHVANGMMFSTIDADNDRFVNASCSLGSGWWFNLCGISRLNGGFANGWSNNSKIMPINAARMLLKL